MARECQQTLSHVLYFLLLSLICVDCDQTKEQNMSKLGIANTATGFSIYRQLLETHEQENIFISPFSIFAAMGLLYLAADGDTKEQMTSALYINYLGDEVHAEFKEFLPKLMLKSPVASLNIANKLFPYSEIKIPEQYLKDSLKFYNTTIEGLDFSNEPKAREVINKWVQSQTDNKIKGLIPAGVLCSRTRLVIVNAIYLKGQWQKMFDKADTMNEPFWSSNTESIGTEMMQIESSFLYMEDEKNGYSAVQLPYKGYDFSMIILLPAAVDGLVSFETKLSPDWLKNTRKNMRNINVNLKLPKFKMKSSFELCEVFKSLGMTDICDEKKANLSQIDPKMMSYVSAIFHKAAVEVNEKGTVAIAATTVLSKKKSATYSTQIAKRFHADHPFLFLIYSHQLDSVLFLGRFVNVPNTKGASKDEL